MVLVSVIKNLNTQSEKRTEKNKNLTVSKLR